MKAKFFMTLIIGLLFGQNLFADSPLTSTTISEAYQDVEIVQLASETKGRLTLELIDYLIDKKNPIDVKMALINELSWDIDGKANSAVFYQYLHEVKNIKNINEASAEILICYAYLKAMDNYFEVDDALEYAKKAKAKSNSYTIHIICGLIEGQKALHTPGWCEVYNSTNKVRINESLKQDMREEAIDIIFEYMDPYAKYNRER